MHFYKKFHDTLNKMEGGPSVPNGHDATDRVGIYHPSNSHSDSFALSSSFYPLTLNARRIVCPSGFSSCLTPSDVPISNSTILFSFTCPISAWLRPLSCLCLLGPSSSHSFGSFPSSVALPVSIYSSRRYLSQCSLTYQARFILSLSSFHQK